MRDFLDTMLTLTHHYYEGLQSLLVGSVDTTSVSARICGTLDSYLARSVDYAPLWQISAGAMRPPILRILQHSVRVEQKKKGPGGDRRRPSGI